MNMEEDLRLNLLNTSQDKVSDMADFCNRLD